MVSAPLGFLIIPKRVEQNQTRIFDRDKLASASSSGNFSVPNSISDSSKNLNLIKNVKHTISDGNKFNNNSNNNNNNTSSQNQSINETSIDTSFSTTNFTNITAQVGSIVELPCTVHNPGEGTVSKLFVITSICFVACCMSQQMNSFWLPRIMADKFNQHNSQHNRPDRRRLVDDSINHNMQ